jgi:hypothetical protein
MVKRTHEYTSPREVEAAFPNELDVSCMITVESFAGVVDPYHFTEEADWVKCQLKSRRGKGRCQKPHGIGWVVRDQDGKVAYIGGDCADIQLDANKHYISEAARKRNELRIGRLVESINAKLSESFRAQVSAAQTRHQELTADIEQKRSAWPQALLMRIREFAKSARRDVIVEYGYPERDEKKRTVRTEWQPLAIGSLAGVDMFNAAGLRSIGARLRAIYSAASGDKATYEDRAHALGSRARTLSDLSQCEAELATFAAAIERFYRPENLQLLYALVRANADRREVATAVLQASGVSRPSQNEVDQAIRSWRSDVSSRNSGHDFRIP